MRFFNSNKSDNTMTSAASSHLLFPSFLSPCLSSPSPFLNFHFPPSRLFFIFYYFLLFLSLCNLFSLPLFLYSSVYSLSTSTNFLTVSTLLFLLPFHPSVLFPASSLSLCPLSSSLFHFLSFVCLLLVSYFLISVPSTLHLSPLTVSSFFLSDSMPPFYLSAPF